MQPEAEPSVSYKAPLVAPPAAVLVRPSVSNNQPLTGWHRAAILTGALMSPYDAAVVHWPPYDQGKRKQPLRSKAEVAAYLATHGMAQELLSLFDFDPKAVLADFPPTDGGPQPLGELLPSQASEHGDPEKHFCRDFWVESVSGLPVKRFFDFDNEAGFRYRYRALLNSYRRSDAEALVAQVQAAHAQRSLDDDARRRRVAQLRARYKPRDPAVFGLRENFISPECLNLLHQAASSRDTSELLESPHLHCQNSEFDGSSDLTAAYSFRLFTPVFCERLARELAHFDDSISQSSANSALADRLGLSGLNGGVPEPGRPKSSDGVVFNRGVLLDEAGFTEGLSDVLLVRVVRPLARVLFSLSGGPSLDHHLCFSVRQQPGIDRSTGKPLDGPHELMVANAEVVLVCCLSGGASGGDLCLYGPRDAPRLNGVSKVPLSRVGEVEEAPGEEAEGSMRGNNPTASASFHEVKELGPGFGGIGEAVMFNGNEAHRFAPLLQGSGERTLLIVWARSSAWRAEYRACDDAMPHRDSSYLYL